MPQRHPHFSAHSDSPIPPAVAIAIALVGLAESPGQALFDYELDQ